MQELIRNAIAAEAKKRLSRHLQKIHYVQKYRKKFQKRTGINPKSSKIKLPKQWSFDKHFDPRYCKKHSKFIAKGIWASLQAGTYETSKAYRISVAKASGGFRHIDAFSIPDAAIAKIFHENLRLRNSKIFSDSSFAYQVNKTPLDAVLKLKSILEFETIFVSQYDFSKYFDSIDHSYINTLLEKTGPFLTTKMERKILGAVIEHRFHSSRTGKNGKRAKGIPQGHSLSLFLANAAAHPLDSLLSKLNGTFARFADDSVVVNTCYEDALKTAEAYQQFSANSGVTINEVKSSGIRIFAEKDKIMEMRQLDHFDFLSYKFTRSGLFMSDRAVAAIKRRCGKIIYNHLILHLRRTNSISRKRVGNGFKDWDLVTCVNELRAYIYGGKSQKKIDEYLGGAANIRNISGATSYFCLIEDSQQFRELDGWLLDCIQRAYKYRARLMTARRKRTLKIPTKKQFISGKWYKFPKVPIETKLPSFFTGWRAARKSWTHHGMGGVDPQGMGYSYI